MQIKTYTIYEYDELDEKAKEKARDWYKQINDYPWLCEAMTERATELLETAGFDSLTIKEVFYSLSWCQGDGAMVAFTGTYKLNGKDWYVTCKHAGHYYHYNSTDYTIEDDNGDDANSDTYKTIKEICVELFQALARYGYDYIEYEDDEENVAETIRANEYTFTIDGNRED